MFGLTERQKPRNGGSSGFEEGYRAALAEVISRKQDIQEGLHTQWEKTHEHALAFNDDAARKAMDLPRRETANIDQRGLSGKVLAVLAAIAGATFLGWHFLQRPDPPAPSTTTTITPPPVVQPAPVPTVPPVVAPPAPRKYRVTFSTVDGEEIFTEEVDPTEP